MVAYKVRKLDGTWYTLGSGSQAKIRALDGSWYVEGNTGPPDAKVRLLAGTMGPGVPFGADGDTIYSTATYFLDEPLPTAGACILQGPGGVVPDKEFHNSSADSLAASYRLRSDGVSTRQDFITWFAPTFLWASPAGAPTPPPGFTVQWCDEDGNERDYRLVQVVSANVSAGVTSGLGGLGSFEGATIFARKNPYGRNIPTAVYANQSVTPTTVHATNGPIGADLWQIPTSTPVGTEYTATVTPNDAGWIGLHFGVNFAMNATSFDLGGSLSRTLGRYFDFGASGFEYKRYYKFVPIA